MIEQSQLITIAQQFQPEKRVITVESFGNGNINDTFLVTLGDNRASFVLQRINTAVFSQPELVMGNMRLVTEHIKSKLPPKGQHRWETPQVLTTDNQQNYVKDSADNYWRAITFINNAQSFDIIQNLNHAQEIGYALGLFHSLISDLPSDNLADTLIGFHITPNYLRQYDQVIAQHQPEASPEVNYCLNIIADRRNWVNILENAKAKGELPLRIIHGDPKINNILIDVDTKQAVSMVDLDTVKPGLIHYDVGDCLRSGCNPLGEETEDWEDIFFETELCEAILTGYLSQASSFLIENDYKYLYDSIRLITWELGLRFFTDYLAGNVYFKVNFSENNLYRAIAQFKLLESIESQEATIKQIIKLLRP